ncbi:glucokinase [Acetobacter sp. AN02]|uniref:glucokinase n=1 Tax=Acetobacter sp. AN02 TaxID=2894186 RepID=UPI0024342100|nr:glucokinase [Acetobacter sp. AN02]MDG6093831.1 glucokinase [Acetobacter sp. AN02]
MDQIACADIGGTNARFTLARIHDGRVEDLDAPLILPVRDFPDISSVWNAFIDHIGGRPPERLSLALPAPVDQAEITMANNPWTIVPSQLAGMLGLRECLLLNDFEAIAWAVDAFEPWHLPRLCGPDSGLPDDGVIIVIGPGTGLGTAAIVRRDGTSLICGAEGGHIGFAPSSPFEDRLLSHLRSRYGRVSAERVISGPGIIPICEVLSADRGLSFHAEEDKDVWLRALSGEDAMAEEAMSLFCEVLGAFAGDIVLAWRASAVVIAGGLGKRLTSVLPSSGFTERFAAKGRFESMLRQVPVRLVRHPEPGLYGAAAALAARPERS